jgi:hypothetical protein
MAGGDGHVWSATASAATTTLFAEKELEDLHSVHPSCTLAKESWSDM